MHEEENTKMTKYESHDNRRHKRSKLTCPVTIFSTVEDAAATVASGDLSDGGVFMAVPVSLAPDVDSEVDLTFSLPREPNRVDCFSARATVVRQDALPNKALSGVALRFKKPISLKLS
jgi:c-di-GMP-binding flagellar brake protein YcgR